MAKLWEMYKRCKCLECKTPFDIPVGTKHWGWSIVNKYGDPVDDKVFCSYRCMRSYERARKAKAEKSERKKEQKAIEKQ